MHEPNDTKTPALKYSAGVYILDEQSPLDEARAAGFSAHPSRWQLYIRPE